MQQRNIAGRVTLSIMLVLGVTGTAGAAWPEKPVRFIVPFATGGGTDLQGRLLSERLRQSLGQPVLVENRPGAGGLIGAEFAAKSAPDGYTVLMTTASIALNVTLQKKNMRFDLLKDFDPVTWVASSPLVLAVHPSVPARSVKELLALVKSSPGGLNIGANGAGTTSHISAEMFKQYTKTGSEVIQYKGGGPSAVGLAIGEVDMVINTPTSFMPHIKANRVRPLAVTTEKPSSWNPALPTMSSFFPGFVTDQWYIVLVPAKTPAVVATTLNAHIKKALEGKEVIDFYRREVLDPVASTPEELTALLKREVAKYADVITKAGIKTQ
jgi:tripartite-type tricarboxylate transporter receptor subunit TctC